MQLPEIGAKIEMVDVKVKFVGKDTQGQYQNDWTFKVSKSVADDIENGIREDFCETVVGTLMSVSGRKFDTMATKFYLTDRDICIVDSYKKGVIYFNDLSYFLPEGHELSNF